MNVRDALIGWYLRRGHRKTGETEPFPYGDDRFGAPLRDDLSFLLLEKDLRIFGGKTPKARRGMSICAMAGSISIEPSTARVVGSKASITLSPKANRGAINGIVNGRSRPIPSALPLLVLHQRPAAFAGKQRVCFLLSARPETIRTRRSVVRRLRFRAWPSRRTPLAKCA